MHTSSIEYVHKSYDDKPEGTVEEFHIHHNGDFSGDAHIIIGAERVHDILGTDSDLVKVRVPFKVLKELVIGRYLQGELISRIEQMDADELLDFLGVSDA